MKKKFEDNLHQRILKKLKSLDKQTQIRVLRELMILEKQPFAGKRPVGHLSGLMPFRVGDYRIIYQLSEKKRIIRTIGHRRKSMDKSLAPRLIRRVRKFKRHLPH